MPRERLVALTPGFEAETVTAIPLTMGCITCRVRSVTSMMLLFTMKILPTIFFSQLGGRVAQRNLKVLVQFVLGLTALVGIYSVLFHFLMAWEGQRFTWLTGVYWTLTVMSTLGFGDITFQSDLGRLFSIVVLLSGTLFMLILLPFTFIQFFYAPWMEAQAAAMAPRELRRGVKGQHVKL